MRWLGFSLPFFVQPLCGGNDRYVITSCGCTTVEYSKTPVQPEKNLTLKVKYTADRPEYFNKTITVYCNEKDSPILLNISGNAK